MDPERLRIIAGKEKFNLAMIEKDYMLTKVLYMIRDIKGMYFKGGTAINKILLEHARLSEDLDFSLAISTKQAEKKIIEQLSDPLITNITKGKEVDGFTRIIVRYRLIGPEGEIFLDLNSRAKLLKEPKERIISHFYAQEFPFFSIKTLAEEELIAEKVAATIGRNKPRDYYDVYNLIKAGKKISLSLVKKKCEGSGKEYDVLKMFNNAQKLKNRWDADMNALIREKVSFEEVMKFLAKSFKLKEEKEKRKERKMRKIQRGKLPLSCA